MGDTKATQGLAGTCGDEPISLLEPWEGLFGLTGSLG